MKDKDKYTEKSVIDVRKRKSIQVINFIIEDLGLENPNQLSEKMGHKRPEKIYKILRGDNAISKNFAIEINSKFPKYKIDDLIEGDVEKLKGEMLTTTEKQKDGITQIDSDNYIWVEFDDLSASAGPLGGNNVEDLPKSKKRLVPREFDNGEYLVVRVDGDSMDNGSIISIPNGTEILIKKYYLNNGDKLPIRDNLFVIVAKEGRALKQIVEHNTETGYIVCHSYNPEYKDYSIPMDEILEIYIYRKITSSRPPIPDIKK